MIDMFMYLRAALLEDGSGGCGTRLVFSQFLLLFVHVSSEWSRKSHQLCNNTETTCVHNGLYIVHVHIHVCRSTTLAFPPLLDYNHRMYRIYGW